jgi:6-phosphogluconolactonase (cycloisomerase 2 family)
VNFNNSGPGNIYQYQIDQVTGALSALSPASIATGIAPFFGAIDPSNTYLYVANAVDVSVSVYKVGPGGLLSQVGTPTNLTGAINPWDLVVDPTDKYLYVDDFSGNKVYGLVLGPNGTIGAATPGSPYTVGGGSASAAPWGLTVDPTGTLLAVDNNGVNTLSVFQLNPTTGALTSFPDVPTGGSPFFVTFYSAIPGQ